MGRGKGAGGWSPCDIILLTSIILGVLGTITVGVLNFKNGPLRGPWEEYDATPRDAKVLEVAKALTRCDSCVEKFLDGHDDDDFSESDRRGRRDEGDSHEGREGGEHTEPSEDGRHMGPGGHHMGTSGGHMGTSGGHMPPPPDGHHMHGPNCTGKPPHLGEMPPMDADGPPHHGETPPMDADGPPHHGDKPHMDTAEHPEGERKPGMMYPTKKPGEYHPMVKPMWWKDQFEGEETLEAMEKSCPLVPALYVIVSYQDGDMMRQAMLHNDIHNRKRAPTHTFSPCGMDKHHHGGRDGGRGGDRGGDRDGDGGRGGDHDEGRDGHDGGRDGKHGDMDDGGHGDRDGDRDGIHDPEGHLDGKPPPPPEGGNPPPYPEGGNPPPHPEGGSPPPPPEGGNPPLPEGGTRKKRSSGGRVVRKRRESPPVKPPSIEPTMSGINMHLAMLTKHMEDLQTSGETFPVYINDEDPDHVLATRPERPRMGLRYKCFIPIFAITFILSVCLIIKRICAYKKAQKVDDPNIKKGDIYAVHGPVVAVPIATGLQVTPEKGNELEKDPEALGPEVVPNAPAYDVTILGGKTLMLSGMTGEVTAKEQGMFGSLGQLNTPRGELPLYDQPDTPPPIYTSKVDLSKY